MSYANMRDPGNLSGSPVVITGTAVTNGVPLPGTLVLLAAGLLGVGWTGRKTRLRD